MIAPAGPCSMPPSLPGHVAGQVSRCGARTRWLAEPGLSTADALGRPGDAAHPDHWDDEPSSRPWVAAPASRGSASDIGPRRKTGEGRPGDLNVLAAHGPFCLIARRVLRPPGERGDRQRRGRRQSALQPPLLADERGAVSHPRIDAVTKMRALERRIAGQNILSIVLTREKLLMLLV